MTEQSNKMLPVITIDGPSGVGKGTMSAMLAKHLNWNYLDSGALYRLTGLAAVKQNLNWEQEQEIAKVAVQLDVVFETDGKILLQGENVADDIRTRESASNASKVAAIPAVREALLQRQKDFLSAPGLVADGRDMGTTVFPTAANKIFLTASPECRGERRYKQLIEKQNGAILPGSLEQIVVEIRERDERDMNRSSSPLRAAEDAVTIDTSDLSIDEVFQQILKVCNLN